jgi:hypothetical protein
LKKGITLVAVLVGVLAVTSGAFAAKQFMITSSSQIKDGSVKLHDLSPGARKALHGSKGIQGNGGPAGPQGPKGDSGSQGPKGEVGPQGAKGDAGPAGTPGKDGKDAPAAEYGAGAIYVTRGTGNPAAWAKYSTRLGSPIGDTTGGAFRFTCSVTQAPCKVAAQAAVLSDKADGNYAVYPRVLVKRSGDIGSGGAPETDCEYADGSNAALSAPLTPVSMATNPFASYAPMIVNIGGTADCGVADAPAGNVNEIMVPSGYYDVTSTFVFTKS